MIIIVSTMASIGIKVQFILRGVILFTKEQSHVS